MTRLLTFILCMIYFPLVAANYYVKPSGGSGSGIDWNNAWSISGLNSHWSSVSGGDTIWLAGGAYTTAFVQAKSGTASALIYVKRVLGSDSIPTAAAGWNSSFDSQVVITAANAIHLPSSHSGDYTVWDGRVDSGISLVVNNSNSGSYDAGFRAGEMSGGGAVNQYVTVTNVEMVGPYYSYSGTYNTYGCGIFIHSADHMTFTHCRIHGFPNSIKMAATYITFDHCLMYDMYSTSACHANIIEATGPGWNIGNITFSNNKVSMWDTEGIVFGYPNGAYYVFGNVFDATGAGGYPRVIETYGGGSSMLPGLLYFYNNTCVNVYWVFNIAGSVGPLGDGFAAGTTVRNNIMWNTKSGSGMTTHYSDYDYANASLGETHSVNGTGATPFVNYAGKDYHIVSTVAANYPGNKGTAVANTGGQIFNIDLDGNTRGADGAWDIGAYEYVSASPTGPTISANPVGATNIEGSTISLSATASGSGTLAYVWKKGGSTVATITGTGIYSKPLATTNDSGSYTVLVTNLYGTALSGAALVSITSCIPAGILTQPASRTNLVGTTASFSVAATGSPALTYQWTWKGSDRAGATGASWVSPALTLADSNSQVYVTIGNGCGAIESAMAILTVTNGAVPVITVPPVGRTNLVGQSVTFSTTATGATGYQWRWGASAVAGATASAWTTPALVLASNGTPVLVSASNLYGAVTSSIVSLGVTNGLAAGILTNPVSISVSAFSNATFTVAAFGNTPYTYQWRFGTNIAGATASSYTRAAVMPKDAGNYTVAVSNAYGGTISAPATLTVLNTNPPVITSDPVSQSVSNGLYGSFTVTANGSQALAYQWRRSGTNVATATASVFSTLVAGDYDCRLTNTWGSATSAVATLTVTNGLPPSVAPTIIVQPVSAVIFETSNVTFTVTATGDAPLAYQWLKAGNPIGGATATDYAIIGAVLADAGAYRVVITNASGSVASSTALLTVKAKTHSPSITDQPQSASVGQGSNVTFSVTASGTAPLAYQWSFNGSNAISGATDASYVLTDAQSTNQGNYSVFITNIVGSTLSSNAFLTVTNLSVPPAVTFEVLGWDTNVIISSNITFTTTATGTTPFGYQYQHAGTNDPRSVNTNVWTIQAGLLDGGQYSVVVTNPAGASVESVQVRLLVPPPLPRILRVITP